MDNGAEWPRISIVTPSYNQGRYIEETIRSVLLQNYPNIEYVIIDGGSTDETVDIIKKYEPWVAYWVSEADNGQSHAINKGFARCTGDIYNWLCSDDIFMKNALARVSMTIDISRPHWILGNAYKFSGPKGIKKKLQPITGFGINNLLQWADLAVHQPSIFWNSTLQECVQPLPEYLHYCMDIDLWYRLYVLAPPAIIIDYLSCARHHSAAKTTASSPTYEKYLQELSLWRLQNIYRSTNSRTLEEITGSLASIQEKLTAYDRLKNHIILGRVARYWRIFINKEFPI